MEFLNFRASDRNQVAQDCRILTILFQIIVDIFYMDEVEWAVFSN
jgi:hypothetical protein